MSPKVSAGSPDLLGLTFGDGGANYAIFSQHATQIDLCLFDAQGSETRLPLPGRTGPIFHGFVSGLEAGQLYGLRVHGPFEPARGHRFNPAKLLVDPYALALDQPIGLHPALFDNGAASPQDTAPFVAKAIATRPVLAHPQRRRRPWSQTIIYELHVRGFTKTLAAVPENLRGTFAGLAHPAAIAHLQNLGVTTLEIMPCAAWIDERHLPPLGLHNYWGYNPIANMAPDPRLAPGGWREVRESVAALQAAGFEVLVDVVLNHSGESDELGPTLCLRGLDNATYYRLNPQDPALYCNDAGCGNVLRLDHPAVLRLAMDSLRVWAELGGVDGFRFDLGVTLARRDTGFDPHAPLLAAIEQDPVLRELKLIAEPWDIGPGGYQLGQFPARWSEWNDRFRDDVRKFWRGDAGMIAALADRLTGSAPIFGGGGRPSRSVNFITAHDGFTLADLVAFAHKHNEANGEENRDGADQNFSWNNGAEGPTDDTEILAKRRRDQRNLLATLLLARGAPMLSMGAEFGQSQHGNNNAYAQDSALSWLDWAKADARLIAFTSQLIALRQSNPALGDDAFLRGAPLDETGFPDAQWFGSQGEALTSAQWRESETRFLGVSFHAPDSRALLLLNAGADPQNFPLPEPRAAKIWRLDLDTFAENGVAGTFFDCGEIIAVEPASFKVLIERPLAEGAQAPGEAKPETLDRLAQAAGLSLEWHDITGRLHQVPDLTKHAILAGMGFDAQTQAQARASLHRLADLKQRRALPLALTAREGEPILLTLHVETPTATLLIEDEQGSKQSQVLSLYQRENFHAFDGRMTRVAKAQLPALPIGRYILTLEGNNATPCHLTVAPPACYLPTRLLAGAVGLSAQLYTLRRQDAERGDQGIGDFTMLGEIGAAAGRNGFACLGLNPMHALMTRNRERASPYHPSDRNFLDPIYLDLEDMAEITGLPLQFDRIQAQALADLPDVDYPAVWNFKEQALRRHFEACQKLWAQQPSGAPAQDFADFIAAGGDALRKFACFEIIAQLHAGADWRDWPAELRHGDATALARIERENAWDWRFILFQQWLCERQLAAAAARAKAGGLWMGLYRDMAVGAAPDGGEGWSNAGLYLHGVSVGAPPDPMAEGGQIWHLPPPDPLKMAAQGFRTFAHLLRSNMRYAGALRIDHALGLMRLFLVPEGMPAMAGAYLSYPLDDLLAQVALESQRAHCLVIGEDLGTVPEGFRAKLEAANVLSYRVLWFERWAENFAPAEAYPAKAVACAATHDLPTLAGWWQGADIAEKAALGLISPGLAAEDMQRRRDDRRRLLETLAAEGLAPESVDFDAPLSQAMLAAIHAFLQKTPAILAMVQIDDLMGETRGVNLPGTDRERPNWRRKLQGSALASLAQPGLTRRD